MYLLRTLFSNRFQRRAVLLQDILPSLAAIGLANSRLKRSALAIPVHRWRYFFVVSSAFDIGIDQVAHVGFS